MAKKTARRKRSARKRTARRSSRAPSRKTARKTARKAAQKPAPARSLHGWITHTELASSDPAATKSWCAAVLGWKFKQSVPMPGGEYHLFTYSDKGGGGIRSSNPPEVPCSIPYVQVADARTAFEKALRAGAEAVLPPERVMEGVTIAIVRAPGGVPIGFAGP